MWGSREPSDVNDIGARHVAAVHSFTRHVGVENDLAARGGRRSIRLAEYDCAAAGSYFVTIETAELRCVLGRVIGREVRLSQLGRLVEQCWREIPYHFARSALDAHVIMPNHLQVNYVWARRLSQPRRSADSTL